MTAEEGVGPQTVVLADMERLLRPRAIAALAIPAATSAVLHSAFRPVDQFFVSWLGTEAQGALGATTYVTIFVFGAYLVISGGVGPLVGRAVGQGDMERARQVAGAGLVGAALVSAAVAVLGVLFTPTIVFCLGLSGTAAAHASDYVLMLSVAGVALSFGPVIDAIFAARGNTMTPLLLQLVVLTLNVLLTPFFLFVVGMGTEGAALGTGLAQVVGVGAGLWLLRDYLGLRWRHVAPSLAVLRERLARIARIGAPLGAGTAMFALVYWALLFTSVSPLGPAVNAGLGIGFSGVEAFSWPLFLGLTVAVQSLVGRCLGAGRSDLAWRAVRMLLLPQLALGCAVAAIFWLAGPWICEAYAADDAARDEALLYVFILAWSQPLVALEAILEGALGGAGATGSIFASTVPFNLIRIPLAWFLAFPCGMGAAGIWWAINATTVMKVAAKGGIVYAGGWSRLSLSGS